MFAFAFPRKRHTAGQRSLSDKSTSKDISFLSKLILESP
jgi:hypothetical protein